MPPAQKKGVEGGEEGYADGEGGGCAEEDTRSADAPRMGRSNSAAALARSHGYLRNWLDRVKTDGTFKVRARWQVPFWSIVMALTWPLYTTYTPLLRAATTDHSFRDSVMSQLTGQTFVASVFFGSAFGGMPSSLSSPRQRATVGGEGMIMWADDMYWGLCAVSALCNLIYTVMISTVLIPLLHGLDENSGPHARKLDAYMPHHYVLSLVFLAGGYLLFAAILLSAWVRFSANSLWAWNVFAMGIVLWVMAVVHGRNCWLALDPISAYLMRVDSSSAAELEAVHEKEAMDRAADALRSKAKSQGTGGLRAEMRCDLPEVAPPPADVAAHAVTEMAKLALQMQQQAASTVAALNAMQQQMLKLQESLSPELQGKKVLVQLSSVFLE
jgi:hypothetical protein